MLDLACHASIAFAAGWLLETKSGLTVAVKQRTADRGTAVWRANDSSAPSDPLWRGDEDSVRDPDCLDVAVAISISTAGVATEVQSFVDRSAQPFRRIATASIMPSPGQGAVIGGEHAMKLAQSLVNRLRETRTSRTRFNIFASAPNAFLVYLGRLSRALGEVVLWEYAFDSVGNFSDYCESIRLP